MIPAILTSNYQSAQGIQKGLFSSNLKTLIYKTDYESILGGDYFYHDGFFLHIEDPTQKHLDFCEKFSKVIEDRTMFILLDTENMGMANLFRDKLDVPIYIAPFSFRNIAGQFFHSKKSGFGHSFTCTYDGIDLKLDSSLRTLTVNHDHPIQLSNKEFQLLQFMFNNRGKLITRLDLLEFVWDRNAMTSSSTIEVHVSRLRKKMRSYMEKDPIQTVPCAGYVFC